MYVLYFWIYSVLWAQKLFEEPLYMISEINESTNTITEFMLKNVTSNSTDITMQYTIVHNFDYFKTTWSLCIRNQDYLQKCLPDDSNTILS